MKTRKTIEQMFHVICMDATRGLRSADEMFVCSMIGDFYYRVYIEKVYNQWKNQERTAKDILSEISGELAGRVFNGMAVFVGRKIQGLINA